jgi:hypothetical protein
LGSVSFLEAHQLLENCAKTGKMVSMEVAELNPFLDEKNISAECTVMLIQSAFGSSILQCGISLGANFLKSRHYFYNHQMAKRPGVKK